MDELEIVEQPELEEGANAEQAEGSEETEQFVGGEEQQVQAPSSPAEIWKQAKEALKDSPQLHAHVKKALHWMGRMDKELPDGIDATVKRLKAIEQLDDNPDDPEYVPGSASLEDVVSNTLAERKFWRDYDNAFQAGDSAIVRQMIDANPESFQKLVPEALNAFAEMNQAGYATIVCQGIKGYLDSERIPLQLALLERVLPAANDPNLAKDPALKTVVDAFQSIKKVFDSIETTAAKPIEYKAGQQSQNPIDPGTDLETREMNILHDEWLREIRPRSEGFTVSEVQKQFPGKRFTPSEVAQIRNAVKEEVNARVRTNLGYQGKIKSLLKAKNKAAYAMTVESEHKKIIPGAVKRAVQDVLEKRGAAKKTVGQNGTKPEAKTATVAQSGTGGGDYELIAQSPTRLGLRIDFRRTSNAMLAGNKAFIIGREKGVRWKGRS